MPTRRQAALLGARAAFGILGIAVIAGTVGAAQFVEWPDIRTSPASNVVSPQPSEQQRVCPGPLLTLAEDSNRASAATSVGSASAVSAARTDSSEDAWTTPKAKPIKAVDNADSANDGSPVLLSVPVEPGATTPPLVAGSQSQNPHSEIIGGFAAAACTDAVSESWLVGGSSDIGNTSLILLANPTTVAASVDLAVYGETGRLDAPGSTGILVQPGEQRIVSLAGLAPNLKSPVVHVTSTGGQVAASLEQSVVHGIEPEGVELIGPTSSPALDQTLSGVLITSSAPPAVPTDAESFSSETPTVRILVPGGTAATVQVGVISEDGAAAGASQEVQLQPGTATEVPLNGLLPGSFTVELRSDQPVVASARTAATGAAAKDFAWFAASAPLPGDFIVSVAQGPSPALHLHNTATTDAAVSVTSERGDSTSVTVPAGQSAVVPVSAKERYAVSGGDEIVASIGYSGDGLLSSFAVRPPGPLATPITVYSR